MRKFTKGRIKKRKRGLSDDDFFETVNDSPRKSLPTHPLPTPKENKTIKDMHHSKKTKKYISVKKLSIPIWHKRNLMIKKSLSNINKQKK